VPPPTGWFNYINYYRDMARLPLVTENTSWSYGDWLHSRYMVKNDFIGHYEESGIDWYTSEGNTAAQNSNVMLSSWSGTSDEHAIDLWMQGPFHAVGIIDPQLATVGFGSYREDIGTWHMGAAVDVLRGLGGLPPSVQFPVKWPSDGKSVPLTGYWGGETPNPLTGCPGYSVPTGLPIILQIGPGNLTPNVTAHSFMQGSTPLEHCVFDETNYTNPDYQSLGRSVLNSRDAIILIPRNPLTAGSSYTASITANGQTHTWTFSIYGGSVGMQGRSTNPDVPVIEYLIR
jgi:hypothetical protein